MTDTRVQSRHQLAHGPEDFGDTRIWWVQGVCFTDNRRLLDRFRRQGLALTEDPESGPERLAWLTEQANYLRRVDQLRQDVQRTGVRPAVALQDHADNPRYSYEAGL
ncbi:hypothetical protein [Saccharothrix deserti]|uniref:hypothetical protein n=1 Tax=Saccharothrix deserti TaxID=2593674 RepID=UPI00131C3FFC|nr:hypothetical protein [Saccharothrix deserti]